MSLPNKRIERFYPDPYTKRLLTGLSRDTGYSKSGIVNSALKEKFERMPQSEKERLLRLSNDK